MKKYKIAFVGLGSIGTRHLKNVVSVLSKREIEFEIDLIRRKESKDISEDVKFMINKVYFEDDELPCDYDVIFVTNPTNLHFETIKKYSKNTVNMFIEKPVFDDYKVNLKDLNLNDDNVYYVACPLRYTEVVNYLKKNVDFTKVFSVRAICSSYLPNWREGVDYRKTYSASLLAGGGVSIDLIHEWDYLIYLLGFPKEINNFRGKFSNLEIDSDDLSIYMAKYDNLLVELHLDYFGRKTVREVHLYTKDDTIIADIANSEIRFLKENKTIKFDEERNAFQCKEIEYFFDILDKKVENQNTIDIALSTLKIAKTGVL